MKKLSYKKIGMALIIVGLLAVFTAGGLWLYNDAEDNEAAEFSESTVRAFFDHIAIQGSSLSVSAGDAPALADGSDIESGVQEDPDGDFRYLMVDGTQYIGVVNIPTLDLTLPINSNWSYPALKNTPCRYSGSIENNNLVIAAHAYRSHFLNIPNLTIGELIEVIDVDGIRHSYQVVKVQVVQPSETLSVVHSRYDLTLFTCTYNGAARAVVRAMLVDDGTLVT